MTKKRPIDIQRDSAGQLEVGTPDDESAITDMFAIGGSFHVIKEKGIYQVKLADEIDPKRTNPKIPNTHQRVLAYGSDNEIVGRILLTAKHLFDPAYLGRSFDHERALVLAFDALKDLLAMHEILKSIEEAEARAKATFTAGRGKGEALSLPSVGDLTPHAKGYVQKAHHALKALLEIVKLFYGTSGTGARFQALAKLTEDRYGKNSPFAEFMRRELRTLQFIWNMRTCVEDPKPKEYIRYRDFSLDPGTATILPPTIEVVHPETPQEQAPVTALMKRATDRIVFIFEGTIAHLCNNNVERFRGREVRVVELPLDRCPNKNVRLNYEILLPGLTSTSSEA
jgi:hypothetical protein